MTAIDDPLGREARRGRALTAARSTPTRSLPSGAGPAGAGDGGRPASPETGKGPRRGLSLAVRVTLLAGLLIVLAVGAAVAITAVLGQRIAAEEAARDLESSSQVQRAFEGQRYYQLGLLSSLFVQDADLAAYLAEAAERSDTASILDILAQRQQDLDFDFAIVLDPQGRVLAHTARPDAVGSDLSDRSLVSVGLAQYEAAGVWEEDGALWDAVIVPVIRGFELSGFLLAGFPIDDFLAENVERISRADVVFLAAEADGLLPAASTLEAGPTRQLMDDLDGRWGRLADELRASEEPVEGRIELGGDPWLTRIAPLRDAAGEVVGASVALTSLEGQLETFQQLIWLLVSVGLAAVVGALVLAYPLARRTLRPLRALARVAEEARRGHYDQEVEPRGGAEVASLALAFDDLLSDLREKRDMEAYMGELSRSLPEVAGASGPTARVERPRRSEAVLVLVELRRHALSRGEPQEVVDRLARDLRRLANPSVARGGLLESAMGHRALISFEGSRAASRALVAVAEILAALKASDANEVMAPVVAMAAGPVVRGGVAWAEQVRPALMGLPVQEVESLLREATPGEIVISAKVLADLGGVVDELGLSPQRSLVGNRELISLDAQALGRVVGTVTEHERTQSLEALEAETSLPGAAGAALTAASVTGQGPVTMAQLAPGAVLGGRFEILSVLGAGGMGVVYKARDRELDDLIALKVLKGEYWNNEEFLGRLKEELKLARRITHPNVLRTHDFGEVDGIPFVSMEYVRGVTLRYLLDRTERLPFSAGLRVSRQIVAALGAAHGVGVIHRDVKPENLILDSAGNAKLMDFGIARLTERLTPGQTKAGFVVGTPQYLSPEQLQGQEVTPAADVYAAGIVLYEVFTGSLPFTAETVAQTISQHLHETPPPPSTLWPQIPRGLEAAILRCLAKKPEERYRDAGALLVELERIYA